MKRYVLATVLSAVSSLLQAQELKSANDLTNHKVLRVEVEPSVSVEVLDWGGTGSTVILIPGLGMTAHSFDAFALKLSSNHRVYGVTRRGVGASDAPAPTATNYSAARLGADVVAVMLKLAIQKAVLIGHSFGGEELSAVGTAHPEMVSGLVYLDAAYGYAFYDPKLGDLNIDGRDVREELAKLVPGRGPLDSRDLLKTLLSQLPLLSRELKTQLREKNDQAPFPDISKLPPFPPQVSAMLDGEQKFTKMNVPVLAIFAFRHEVPKQGMLNSETERKAAGGEAVFSEEHAEALKAVVPSALIIRIPDADHFVFKSNEGEVLRETEAFICGLRI